jgi:hypothetical protein
MSVDAFAAAIGKGAALHRPRWSEALRTGLIFGAVETLTPVLGWALGLAAASYVDAVDHWLAFLILGAVGGRMVVGALRTPRRRRSGRSATPSGCCWPPPSAPASMPRPSASPWPLSAPTLPARPWPSAQPPS